jgi:hypothetical protein
MSGSAEANHPPKPDALEIATDRAIAAHGGDLRATVRRIVANGLLEAELKDVYARPRRATAWGRKP